MKAAECNTQQLKQDSTIHNVNMTSAKEKECHKFGLRGHIARVWHAKKHQKQAAEDKIEPTVHRPTKNQIEQMTCQTIHWCARSTVTCLSS